ncbi:ribosomal RNA-processing protein 8-like [Mizuhopecten yessoensis]|uniref:Uncharacterized protein n=1 Tax=Mizuhopecten yessoensis TaxID=6573 RepID=A0A210PU24_MIZYE|nr:ribosomal RNA-processing protein 8-like [Mizuhopecten yessoensis]OWF39955.1 hypothetical protein KP79_PYT04287 [Mizuhopecten yessoensis]
MGSSSKEKKRRKRQKVKTAEKKKNLQKKLARIDNVEMLTKEQVKNILIHTTCASKVTGKRKRRVTKRLKHLAKKTTESQDVEMNPISEKKQKGRKEKSSTTPVSVPEDSMDTADD